jgi:predicted nucleic acid-binding protein
VIVLLDSRPLGLLANRRRLGEADRCHAWYLGLPGDVRVVLPEIVDYELRRELLLNGNRYGLRRLELFKEEGNYLPLTTAAVLSAAQLWADVRRRGQPTADPRSLDADALLAGQALTLDAALWGCTGDVAMVATTNALMPRTCPAFVRLVRGIKSPR